MSNAVSMIGQFRQWYKNRNLSKGRLIQYCGRERTGAFDFSIGETEQEIEGLLAEGFYLDWSEHNSKL